MRGTPKEAKAAEREFGRITIAKLEHRPAPASGQQSLEASGAAWSNEAANPASKGAKQRPLRAGIIPMQGGRSNGNPFTRAL